ncbi:methyltransferase RsmF C-terminal domain-like protein [Algoriphagus limi]|uniref:tRNA/rRNA cytosine-C5-methylase n=1 Tax=Algoriphagus limi TaxID=2975273 RepID=A0ABT2G6R4_9BACT|nr:tRNA/rRNA cytosine-C5-methylase [Algoriphagus limi]MCS5490954.1 tRNA/rRNA cytosine-C5-methylase [Algoriphagus limi]
MSEAGIHLEFQKRMIHQLGTVDYEDFELSLQKESPTTVRLNPFKIQSCPFEGNPIPWSEFGFSLEKRPAFTLDPLFHAGAYYVQEASSMFISEVLRQLEIPKGIFLDLAAAPGGKSTLLSTYLAQEGLLVANEVIQSRNQILKENLIKWGLGNSIVTQNDPAHFQELEGFFDLVLIDAPCSGEGMFRKDPEARKEWSPDHVRLCAGRQQRILDQAGGLVKGGGYLIYSTCTFNEQENEEMIRFLTSEFAYEPVRIKLNPEWQIEESEVQTEEGTFFGYRFYPHRVEGEGFFISVLKRPNDAYILEPRKKKDFKHQFLKLVDEKTCKALDEELGFENSQYYLLNDSYFRFPEMWKTHLEQVIHGLNIRYLGTEIGKKQKNEWIPSHDWAVSILPKNGFSTKEVSLEEALDFLRKNEQELILEETGWVLLTYQNLPIGWVKNLGNRINNYYPKEWRIRNL